MTFPPKVATAISEPAHTRTSPTHRWPFPADRRHSRGQSLVEFALVLIPMMLLLLGAIQFGVIWATQIGVTNAVRDVARVASMVQPKLNAAGDVTQPSEAAYAVSVNLTVPLALAANVPFYSSSDASTQVCYSTFTNAAGVDALQATVTVTYAHPIFIPLLSGILGDHIVTTTSLSIPVGMEQPYEFLSPPSTGCSS